MSKNPIIHFRVDITENSTFRVAAGHGDVSYESNPNPPQSLPSDSSSKFVYLSIDELMNQDKEQSKKVVGALRNQDTGSLHPLQLYEQETKQEVPKVEHQQIGSVSWCSFYVFFKVFGLILLTCGIILLIILSLPEETLPTKILQADIATISTITTTKVYREKI